MPDWREGDPRADHLLNELRERLPEFKFDIGFINGHPLVRGQVELLDETWNHILLLDLGKILDYDRIVNQFSESLDEYLWSEQRAKDARGDA